MFQNFNNFLNTIFSGLGELIFSAILGLIQGITEVLPISSTAHLRIFSYFTLNGLDISLQTSNIIQIATTISIILVFWKDVGVIFSHTNWLITNPKAWGDFVDDVKFWILGQDQTSSQKINIDPDLYKQASSKNNKNIDSEGISNENLITIRQEYRQKNIFLAQLAFGTLPIVILGLLLKNFASQNRELQEIGSYLIAGAVLLIFAEYIYKKIQNTKESSNQEMVDTDTPVGISFEAKDFKNIARINIENTENTSRNNSNWDDSLDKQQKSQKSIRKNQKYEPKPAYQNNEFSFSDCLLIGIFQSLAVFPGMSRSGSTLAGALLLGRNRLESVRFAFLLGIPATILAGLLDLFEFIWNSFRTGFVLLPQNDWLGSPTNPIRGSVNLSVASMAISFLIALISGYISFKWILGFLGKNSSKGFIIYRIVLGIFLLLVALFDYLSFVKFF